MNNLQASKKGILGIVTQSFLGEEQLRDDLVTTLRMSVSRGYSLPTRLEFVLWAWLGIIINVILLFATISIDYHCKLSKPHPVKIVD